MTNRTDTRSQRPAAFDSLFDDESLTHHERIEYLVAAAISEPETRLRFEEELARGGMGSVRQAFDVSLQRRMAVKTIHEATYGHVLLVHGFLREAQVTGQLDHPNIVPIHELGRNDEGELYFTMKIVDGDSLYQRIGRSPPGSYEQLKQQLEVFVKVCDALAFAHSRGVIHCDIKSANVMVGRFGQAYLMDWGGAQLLPQPADVDTSEWVRDSLPTPKPIAGVVFGTPAYMSPEQASAGRIPLDVRSDIFSMGALLYEILVGRPPYTGGTAREGVARAASHDFTPIPERPHVYPRELIRIAMTAMARDPADRYQTVEDLQAAITGLLSGGGNFPTMRVPAGAHVIREGDVGDAAYWVESGTFEVYQVRDGVRSTVRTLTGNVFFGETAIFARTTRTASVVALTDGVLRVFTAAALEGQLDTMPPWMRSLIQTMAKWFAGSADHRRAPAASPSRPKTPSAAVMPGPDASVTELFGESEQTTVTPTRGGAGHATSRDEAAPEWGSDSLIVDIVDDPDQVGEFSDLADGSPPPTEPTNRPPTSK